MPRSLLFFLAALPLAGPLAAQTPGTPERQARSGSAVQLMSGFEYKEGNYGTSERLESFSIPMNLYVARGQFQFSASLPYLRINGPASLIGGGGFLGIPIIFDPTRPSTRSRREGIGDLRVAAAYTLPFSSVGLTFSGEAKLPTASRAKGLGTGATDFALGAELSKRFGPVTPFVGMAYTLPGDPEGFELRNALSTRAGAAVQMTNGLRAHLAYSYAQSTSAQLEEEQQISTGLNANLSKALSLGVYGSAGLSETSPDVGAGVQVGIRIR